MRPEPNEPMVCITHLHALLEGQNCEEEEKLVEKCKLCGETFQSKRELLSHLKVHKSKKILEENQQDLYEGEVERSGGKGKRKQRQKRKHSPGPILCPNCGSSFNSKTLVTRHQRYAHTVQ